MKKILLSIALCCYGLLGHTQSAEMVQELNKPFPNFSVLETEADKYYRNLDPEKMTDEEKSFTKHFARWYHANKHYIDANKTLLTFAQKRANDDDGLYYCGDGNANWQPLGPVSNVIGNNGIGRIDAVSVNPTNQQDVIIASRSGGLWRTTNGGQNWTNVTSNFKIPFLEFKSITRDPQNPNRLLACSGAGFDERILGRSNGGGLGAFKSTDGGATWNRLSDTFSYSIGPIQYVIPQGSDFSRPLGGILYHPTINGKVYAIGGEILYVSNNHGDSWNPLTNSNHISDSTGTFNTIHFTNETVPQLVIDAGNGIFHEQNFSSPNSDMTNIHFDPNTLFTPVNSSTVSFATAYTKIAIPQSGTSNSIYAFSKILELSGSGATLTYRFAFLKATKVAGSWVWTVMNSNLSSLNISGRHGWGHTVLEVSPVNSNRLYLSTLYGGQNFYSTNGGATWNSFSGSRHDDPRESTVFVDQATGNETFYIAHDGGLSTASYFPSSSSSSSVADMPWNGLSITQMYFADVSKFGNRIIAGTQDNGTMRYGNSGNSWTHMSGGDGGACEISDSDDHDYWFAVNQNLHYRADDFSSNPFYARADDWDTKGWKIFDAPIAPDPDNEHIVFTTRIEDNHKWKLMKVDYSSGSALPTNLSTSLGLFDDAITAIKAISSDVILFSVKNEAINDELYLTTDGGQTWETITPRLNDTTKLINWGHITDIEASTGANGEIKTWLSVSGFTSHSEDTRRVYYAPNVLDTQIAWTPDDDGLPDLPVLSIEKQSGYDDIVYAATPGGVFYKSRFMSEWECFSDGLVAMAPKNLRINECQGKLFLATYTNGLWSTDLVENTQNSQTYSAITGTETWDSDRAILEGVTVHTGGELTIENAQINLAKDVMIRVLRGGKLIIKNSTLTNGCNELWGGIAVSGTSENAPGQTTLPTQFWNSNGLSLNEVGILEIENSTIEYAREAVRLHGVDPNGNTMWNHVGGVVQAQNAVFRNNKRCVEFLSYKNHYPSWFPSSLAGKPAPNRSYFSNCEFVYDAPLPEGAIPGAMITMNEVKGVRVLGCDFKDEQSTSPTVHGIHTVDADFAVNDICLSYPTPCSSNKSSSFQNLRQGVTAITTHPSGYHVNVENSEFIGCRSGVVVDGHNHAIITKNTIEAGDDWPTIFGIYVRNATNYKIEENLIRGRSVGNRHFTYGMVIGDSGGDRNETYKNDVAYTYQGLVAFDRNYDDQFEYAGFAPMCDKYNHMVNDYFNTGNLGAAKYAGSPVRDAGNEFHTQGNSEHIEFDDNTNLNLNYYHWGNTLPKKPTTTIGVNTFDIRDDNDPDKMNKCLSQQFHDDGKSGKRQLKASDVGGKKSDFSQHKNNYLQLLATYNSLLDGGDRALIESAIQNASSPTALQLKQELLDNSPLSADVVFLLIEENTLPNALLYEVLLANKHLAKNGELMEMLATKSNPMPSYMINLLLGHEQDETLVDNLLAEIGMAYGKARTVQHEIIETYAADSVIEFDSLLAWSNKMGTYYERMDVAGLKLDYTSFGAGLNDVSVITEQMVLTEDQSVEQDRVHDYLANSYGTYLESKGADGITVSEGFKASLLNRYNEEGGRSGGYARNLYLMLNGMLYEPELLETASSGKKATARQTHVQNEQAVEVFNIFPNPTKEYATISWNAASAIEGEKYVELYSIKGKLLMQKQLGTAAEGQQIIELTNLATGVYELLFYIQGNKVETQTLYVVQ